jgi:hypothetical protein
MIPQSRPFVAARRQILVGGVALVSTSLLPLSAALAQRGFPGVIAQPGGTKPTYLPQPGSRDPVAHSIAENLFWNEQLMEHAVFFTMLMPGPELASQRAEAERFRATFAAQLARTRAGLRRINFQAFNRTTINHVRRFVDFKHRMERLQASGRLKSLVWPTFFDHTAREADYFADRLARLSRGETAIDGRSAADFWARIMGEHADFVAHLLDPEERALIAKAIDTSRAFHAMRGKAVPQATALTAVDQIIDFKVAAERGINAGQIKSIIHPTLADHVRREALKAADDLRRSV